MLTLLEGFPSNILAVKASGTVTQKDYNEVLIPAADKLLAQEKKIRVYYELGKDFVAFDAGAMWEDCKLGFEYLTRWDRAAVVTDVEWIKWTMNAFRFLFPIRVFSSTEAAQAQAWISGD
ncbi:MAG: STAS/SEC14 domain-containing protein [Alphaproteobacteria bacterium]|nr:STAS/SEC14 domain-containing protein [Alphaproteobacteria bacterium]